MVSASRMIVGFVCLLLSGVLMLTTSSPVFAHALQGQELSSAQTVVVECVYSTGDTANYAAVNVFSPENAKIEFQNGRTDARGRFAFYPDTVGEWRLEVTDGMGHKLVYPVTITKEWLAGGQASSGAVASQPAGKANLSAESSTLSLASLPLWLRAVFGVSVLINLVLGLQLLLRRTPRKA